MKLGCKPRTREQIRLERALREYGLDKQIAETKRVLGLAVAGNRGMRFFIDVGQSNTTNRPLCILGYNMRRYD